MKSLSRYAAENRWRKRQHSLKKRSLWKGTKGHAMISTRQCFMKIAFWNRRPDGRVINKYHRTLHILEFKRSSDRNKDFLRVKEDEANEQHRSIIEALKAAALEWTFEQINFVAERRGAVVEDDSYNKLEKLNVQAGKRDKIMLAHVQRICKAHDTVMRSYHQQIQKWLWMKHHIWMSGKILWFWRFLGFVAEF